ncbi:DUF2877 domain-containing protein [Mumia sp. ZJ430]|uniref:oxamate carbamoyltransferase subunit AllH family protein n=1 Tax=Mumia sp. ZJ430 TaxID=2708083 RepID=UPI00142221DB|nr:DUF2877 domain-containing protein [Mumia sp. ZJ430]
MAAPIRLRTESAGRLSPSRPAPHPAAATAGVAAVLRGPRRVATIVARSPYAVYAQDRHTVVAVLARDAVVVPCGLATGWNHVGDAREVVLGAGRCTVDGREVRVGRLVDATVRPVIADAGPVAADADELLAAVMPHLPGLPEGTYDALRADDPAAATALLGRGPGLTPLGDDVLAGWLVGRYARGHRGGRVAAAVLTDAPARTTTVSAVLLAHAVRGEAVPQLRAYLADPEDPTTLAALRAVGHTSGTGLALGVALSVPLASPLCKQPDAIHLPQSI